MERSSDDPRIDPAALEQEWATLRAAQDAWRGEQKEWEEVRSQVEQGLSDLEMRLLEQAKRLRCPRGSEEFEAALREQLDIAVERQRSAEARLAESERRRDELVEDLQASDGGERLAERGAEINQLRDELAAAQAGEGAFQGQLVELETQLNEARAALSAAQAETATLQGERESLNQSLSAAQADLGAATASAEEIEALRTRCEEAETNLVAYCERAEALEAACNELNQAVAERDAVLAQGQRAQGDLETRVAEAEAKAQELALVASETDALRASLAAVTADRDAQGGEIESLRQQLATTDANSRAAVAERDARAAEVEAVTRERDELRREAQRASELATEVESLGAQRLADEQRFAEQDARIAELASESAQKTEELATARIATATADERAAEAGARVADLENRAAEAESLRGEVTKLRKQQKDALVKQRERMSALDTELSAFDEDRAKYEAEIEELTKRLEQAAAGAVSSDAQQAQQAALQEKFDLAIADLQAHREHVAVLEEQLAAQPSVDPAAVDQVQQLLAEREELIRQIESGATAVEPSQEIEDLRARFEMAVEDVRRLKEENQDLSERLASAGSSGGAIDENDWEAQKRRLLASLEGEGEPAEPARQEERATIAGTIQVTDEIVAAKDREIEQLRAAIDSGESVAPAPTPVADPEAVAAALDNDAVVQAERERIAKLEEELSEQLRAAELELSVERAKITRAQAELEEQQIELETLRAANGLAKEAADGAAPKRRWLDKLGLGGEGQ